MIISKSQLIKIIKEVTDSGSDIELSMSFGSPGSSTSTSTSKGKGRSGSGGAQRKFTMHGMDGEATIDKALLKDTDVKADFEDLIKNKKSLKDQQIKIIEIAKEYSDAHNALIKALYKIFSKKYSELAKKMEVTPIINDVLEIE